MVGTAGRSGGNRTVDIDKTPQDGGSIKPKRMPQAVADKWDELLPQLPQQALRRIDGYELKLLVEVLVMADNLAAAMLADPADHRTGRLYLNALDRVHRLSASFGLNPGDRKRLQLPDESEKQPDPFQELLARDWHIMWAGRSGRTHQLRAAPFGAESVTLAYRVVRGGRSVADLNRVEGRLCLGESTYLRRRSWTRPDFR